MYVKKTSAGIVVGMLTFFFVPGTASAYTLLAPIFNTTSVSTMGDYLALIFGVVLGIASIAAVVMIVVAGLQYIASGANESLRGAAKERIRNALFGLIIALGAWVVLNAINPDLVSFGIFGGNRGNLGSGAMGVTLPGGLDLNGQNQYGDVPGGEPYCYQISSDVPITCFGGPNECGQKQPEGPMSAGCQRKSFFNPPATSRDYCFTYSNSTAKHVVNTVCRHEDPAGCARAQVEFASNPTNTILTECTLRVTN